MRSLGPRSDFSVGSPALGLLTGLPRAVGCAALLSALLGYATPSAAQAAGEPAAEFARAPGAEDDPRWQKAAAIQAHLGFGTPLGYYGLAVEYSLTPWLSASAGVGRGSGPYCLAPDEQPRAFDKICGRWHRDLQYASLLRARYILEEITAIGFGAGPSFGGYTWVEPLQTDGPAYKSTERAYWLNVEAFAEARSSAGLLFRGFVGYGFMLNPSDLGCVSWGAGSRAFEHCRDDHPADGKRLIYLGFAGGLAL